MQADLQVQADEWVFFTDIDVAFGQMRVDDSDEIDESATTAPPPADEEPPPHPRRSSRIATAADGPVATATSEPPAPTPMPARMHGRPRAWRVSPAGGGPCMGRPRRPADRAWGAS